MRTLLLTCACFLLLAIPFGSQAHAQEAAKPGPEHEVLQRMAGDWDWVLSLGDIEFTGTSTMRVELNGLHLIQVNRGTLGDVKYEGRGVTSYCPVRKKYLSTWVDNMSSSANRSEGTLSEDGKQLTELTEAAVPNQGLVKMKVVTTFVNADEIHSTAYSLAGGQETEVFQLTYKRQAKSN